MSEFLETLKTRMAEAQKRFNESQQKLQVAQLEHQTAAQEFSSWQKAVEVEARREAAIPAGAEGPLPIATRTTVVLEPSTTEPNKTQMIRELLRDHPAGMTPGEVWRAVKNSFPHRAYVYSVLKRLTEREQIIGPRRGKYFFRVPSKPEEGKLQEPTIVH
jgi:hypothetical protein